MKQTILWMIPFATAVTLSACGGGGGNGGSTILPPVAIDDSAQTNKATPVTVNVVANDSAPSGTLLPDSVTIVTPPGNGSHTVNPDGTVTYTPASGFTGSSDSFTYTVKDNLGGTSNVAKVTVTIQNQPPVASNDCQATPQESPFSGTLPGSDPDGSMLTFSLLDNGSNAGTGPITTAKGQIEISDPTSGAFIYTPNPHPSRRGSDRFTYRVVDTEGASATAEVTIIIEPRIMPLGDSITQGIVDKLDPPLAQRIGYRQPLYESLVSGGYDFDFVGVRSIGESFTPRFDADNEGYAGAKDEEIAFGGTDSENNSIPIPGIFDALEAEPADIVLLHIGTNDINQDPADATATDVQNILTEIGRWEDSTNGNPVAVILARIIDQCNGLPALCNPEPAVVTFNDNVVTMAQGLGAASGPDELFIADQRSALLDQAGDPDLGLYGNDLHPNQTGYDKMAAEWFSRLTDPGGAPAIFEKCP